jgi:hypothetical protein
VFKIPFGSIEFLINQFLKTDGLSNGADFTPVFKTRNPHHAAAGAGHRANSGGSLGWWRRGVRPRGCLPARGSSQAGDGVPRSATADPWLDEYSRGPRVSFWSVSGGSAVLGCCRGGHTWIWLWVGGCGTGHRPGARGGASRAVVVVLWHLRQRWVAAVAF